MSYACVAIVFAAVFVVNTLAAAVMSGVFSMGAKKTALTAQTVAARLSSPEMLGRGVVSLPTRLGSTLAVGCGNAWTPQ